MLEKRIRMSALIILIILVGASSIILSNDTAKAQEEGDVRLYLRTGNRLTTEPPSGSTEGSNPIAVSGSLEIEMEYPFAHDVVITGPVESGAMVVLLHLEILLDTVVPGELDIELYKDPFSGSSVKFAGATSTISDIAGGDIKLPFISNQGQSFEAGSRIRMVVTYTSGTLPLNLIYSSLAGQSSYIEFVTSVFPGDPVEVQALNAEGDPIEDIIPYGPEEARTLYYSASVKDVFGAYDMRTISLLITSSTGSVLLNTSTDGPEPSGGEPITYFNDSYTFPEGTPTDTYTITAIAESFTGYTAEGSIDIDVSPGLFVTIDDPDIGVDAGDAAIFSMEVLNGGDGVDRVSFSADSKSGWTIDTPLDLEIDGGDTSDVEFKVYVPFRAEKDTIDEITFTATSRNADKDYSVQGTVEVESASSFGLDPIGDLTKSVFAGGSASYEVRVINILNRTSQFEISDEDLPISWNIEYDTDGGSLEGSLYEFEINATGEKLVSIDVDVDDDGPFGSNEFSVSVRAKGEVDRKSVYLKTNVVDETRDVVELSSGSSRKTASRTGSGYPITYDRIYFAFDLYNPVLESSSFEMTIEAPDQWGVEYDFDEIDLLPGEGSVWNMSVIPKAGTPWQGGSPYFVDVEIDAGSEGEFSESLEIVIPKITSIKSEKEWDSVNAIIGDTIPVNLTLSNRGNHAEDVVVTPDLPSGLQMNYTGITVNLAPGGSKTILGELTIESVEEVGPVSFSIDYETSKGTTTLDYTLKVSEKSEEDEPFNIMIIAVAAVIVIALALGALIYLKFFSGKDQKKKAAEPQKDAPAPRKGVSVSAEAPSSSRPAAAKPAVDTEVLKEADDILKDILGEDKGPVEVEKFEVVEAKEME